jgi:hypothetical protein
MLTWALVLAFSLAQHGKEPGSQRQTFVSPDHGRSGEGGAGNHMGSDFYRVFHKRKCYELSTSIASSSFANFDPGTVKEFTREDERRVQSELMAILDSFRFLK